MAKCEEGYLCEVCGQDVASLAESDLYLRYVLGMVPPEVLHVQPERHIRCNPVLAQFIVADAFPAVVHAGPSDKRLLDPTFVAEREARVTAGWQRLCSLEGSGLAVIEYPLPDVLEKLRTTSGVNSPLTREAPGRGA